MKILHIIPTLRKGGAERMALDICRELQRRDVKVMLMVLYEGNDFSFLSKDVQVIQCNSRFQYSITGRSKADFSDYIKIVEEFAPDIVASHLFEAEFFSREYLFPNIAYFSHMHNNMPQFENFKLNILRNKKLLANYFEKKHLVKKYLQCKNFFIANSNDTWKYFKDHLPRKLSGNIHLLPNAVDLSLFTRADRTLNNQELRLISVGSLLGNKNHLFLIQVMKLLRARKINAKLDILGDGLFRDEIEKKISQNNLNEMVSVQGSVDNVHKYLARAHLYLHAAISESFGLAIVEGMATGLPVVCIDAKGNRDIVDDGINGFMIEKPDVKLFTQKILAAVKDEATYQSLSEHARKKAELYDIKLYGDKLVTLYQKALRQ